MGLISDGLLRIVTGVTVGTLNYVLDKEAEKSKKDLDKWFNSAVLISKATVDNSQIVIRKMKDSTPIYLELETDNQNDKSAIAIYEGTTNNKIGYIPKEWNLYSGYIYNYTLANYMRRGGKVYIGTTEIIKNENYFSGINRTETIYQVEVMLSNNIEDLNNNIRKQKQDIKERAKTVQAKIDARLVSHNESSFGNWDDIGNDTRSDREDYDENGVSYEDYDRD